MTVTAAATALAGTVVLMSTKTGGVPRETTTARGATAETEI